MPSLLPQGYMALLLQHQTTWEVSRPQPIVSQRRKVKGIVMAISNNCLRYFARLCITPRIFKASYTREYCFRSDNTLRLDFRHFLVRARIAGSFPDQRLVIEPTTLQPRKPTTPSVAPTRRNHHPVYRYNKLMYPMSLWTGSQEVDRAQRKLERWVELGKGKKGRYYPSKIPRMLNKDRLLDRIFLEYAGSVNNSISFKNNKGLNLTKVHLQTFSSRRAKKTK